MLPATLPISPCRCPVFCGEQPKQFGYTTANYNLLKCPAANVRILTIKSGLLVSTGYCGAAGLLATLLPVAGMLAGPAMVMFLSPLKHHCEQVV